MKIVGYCHRMDRTGAPLILFRLLERLRRRHHVDMLLPQDPIDRGSLQPDYKAAGIELLQAIRPNEYDVMLGNTVMSATTLVNAGAGVPTLWWVHEPNEGAAFIQKGYVDERAFDVASRIVFPTRWQAESVYAEQLGDRAWSHVPYGINLASDDADAPPPWSLPDGSIVLLSLAWLAPRKGQHTAIAALEKLADPRVHLILAGNDTLVRPFTDHLRSTVAASPFLSEHVHFAGVYDQSQVKAALRHCDAFVFPTNDDLITLSILEAMSMETCVVSSDFGPIPETVIHDETGLLFPTDDSDGMADALRRVVNDPALRRRLGKAGREIFERKHSFDGHVDAMEAELEATVAAGPWPGGVLRENQFFGVLERPRSAADEPADDPVPPLLEADGGIRIDPKSFIANALLMASEGWVEDALEALEALDADASDESTARFRSLSIQLSLGYMNPTGDVRDAAVAECDRLAPNVLARVIRQQLLGPIRPYPAFFIDVARELIGAVNLGLLVIWRQFVRLRTGRQPDWQDFRVADLSAEDGARMFASRIYTFAVPMDAPLRYHRFLRRPSMLMETRFWLKYIHAATNLDRPADATPFVHGAATAYPNDKQSVGAAVGHLGKTPTFSTKADVLFLTRGISDPTVRRKVLSEFGYGTETPAGNMSD